MAARHVGMEMPALCAKLVAAALERRSLSLLEKAVNVPGAQDLPVKGSVFLLGADASSEPLNITSDRLFVSPLLEGFREVFDL